jgi:hypothetical protein
VHTKLLPCKISLRVTITVAIVGVVEMAEVKQGIVIVPWVLTEPTSSIMFECVKHLQRELRVVMAAS